MRELPITREEARKAWFIDISKMFHEKNLKIFYLPFASLDKLVRTKTFTKIPDPNEYLVGVSFNHLFNSPSPDSAREYQKLTDQFFR